MKNLSRIIFATFALIPLLAFGAANDLKFSQQNSSGTAWIDRIFQPQTGSAVTSVATFGDAIGLPWNQPTSKSADFTVAITDKGKIFMVTTGSSTITATLPAAATAGASWYVMIRKADSGSGKVVTSPATSALAVNGHTIVIYTDGSSYFERDYFGGLDSSGALTISTGNSQSILFKPNGTTALTLDSSQNATFAGQVKTTFNSGPMFYATRVTDSGDARMNLEITGGANTGRIEVGFYGSTGTLGVASAAGAFQTGTNHPLRFGTNATLAMTIDTSQNVVLVGNISKSTASTLTFSAASSQNISLATSAGGVVSASNGTIQLADSATQIARVGNGLFQITGQVAVNGGTPSATTSLLVSAATTGVSSLRIPPGTAPTSPVSGDVWYDGTNLKFRDGTTTRTITWTP